MLIYVNTHTHTHIYIYIYIYIFMYVYIYDRKTSVWMCCDNFTKNKRH